jgi:hypothetical protein
MLGRGVRSSDEEIAGGVVGADFFNALEDEEIENDRIKHEAGGRW